MRFKIKNFESLEYILTKAHCGIARAIYSGNIGI